MEGIKRPQRNARQSLQELTRTNGVLIIELMNFQNPSRDVVFEFCDHAPFQAQLDLAIAPAPTEEASHLDYGKAADR
jgi:hypothetical protein